MGMGGTAALTTVKLVGAYGSRTPFVLTAAVLAVYAVLAWLLLRDAPERTVPAAPLSRRGQAFSAPVGYLTRPYVVYRSRDARPGLRPDRPGWEGPPKLPSDTAGRR